MQQRAPGLPKVNRFTIEANSREETLARACASDVPGIFYRGSCYG